MSEDKTTDEAVETEDTAAESTDDKASQDEDKQAEEKAEAKSNDIEDLASEMGWTPDFEGRDGKEAVDAKTFIKNTVNVNKAQNVTIGKLTKDLGTIKIDVKKALKHQDAATADRIEGLKAELKELKRAAIKDGDVDEVEKIEQQITEIDEKAEEANEEEETKKDDPDYAAWKVSNDWYGNDIRLSRYADAISEDKEYSGLSMKELLVVVDKEIAPFLPKKEKVPETTPGRKNKQGGVNDVVGNSNSSHSGKRHTVSDLPEGGEDVAKSLVKSGVFKNKQEYVDDYFKGIEGVLS